MSTKKEYTYKDFLASEETKNAAQNRDKLSTEKPKDFQYEAYKPSETVTQAQNMLNQQIGNKPQYTSQWQSNLNETLNKILNREKFDYDLNGDALYQQYKNQYVTQGQQAMMDAMGQAQSMTGGYGNSYAQTAGQQAYQGYLQQMNNKIPELYQLALNQYNREGDELYNQYGLFADRENLDYGRYRDQLSDYNAELDRLTNESRYQAETDYNRYMDQYNMAYGQHRDSVADWQTMLNRADAEYWNLYNRDYGQYTDNRNFGYDQFLNEQNFTYQQQMDALAQQQWQQQFDYGKEQDALAQQQWQNQFDYQKQQDAIAQQQWQSQFDYGKYWDEQNLAYQKDRDKTADAQWQAEFDEAVRQYNQQFALENGTATGGSSGGGGETGGNSSEEIKELQRRLNELGADLEVDGIKGPATEAAIEKYLNGDKGSAENIVRAQVASGTNRNESKQYLYAKYMTGEIDYDEYVRLMSAYT